VLGGSRVDAWRGAEDGAVGGAGGFGCDYGGGWGVKGGAGGENSFVFRRAK
jgi:hypothetical protein